MAKWISVQLIKDCKVGGVLSASYSAFLARSKNGVAEEALHRYNV